MAKLFRNEIILPENVSVSSSKRVEFFETIDLTQRKVGEVISLDKLKERKVLFNPVYCGATPLKQLKISKVFKSNTKPLLVECFVESSDRQRVECFFTFFLLFFARKTHSFLSHFFLRHLPMVTMGKAGDEVSIFKRRVQFSRNPTLE